MQLHSLPLLALVVLASDAPASLRTSKVPPARVTILYDAFGSGRGLTQDWGFAALIEYDGHRILFDTGNDAKIFEQNVRALHVDLRHLDFAVISHRHGDHVAGLAYLLRVNPNIKIYAPRESFGVFGSSLPSTFYRTDSALPPSSRYFDGAPAAQLRFGAAWPEAHFTLIDTVTEVAPGITLISTVSRSPGTLELRELSLVIRTPNGALLVVGCSHPGIETILQSAVLVTPDVALIVGGLHWVASADSTIARLSTALHDRWHVRQIGPGHCTGEPGFAALQSTFGGAYLYAGLGSVLERAAGDSAQWTHRAGASPN